jgi:hypothetical protein
MSAKEPHAEKPGTVSLADEEAVKQILVSRLFGFWDIVNNLTRLRPSKQERYRVTIFGSARAKPGTSELMVIWQLLQVKHVHDTPLILIGKMWAGLVDWASTHFLKTDPPLANPEDMTIPRCVDTSDEAVALLREHHARWLRASNG